MQVLQGVGLFAAILLFLLEVSKKGTGHYKHYYKHS